MAKDPAFLFYPGDYLRDTQCLSSNAQVAYDRIMCEHMRNICITQQQLNFFTKRLSEDEKQEVLMVLTCVEGGFCIQWVSESIVKRKAYSESRRKNREGKNKNICKTYDKHMENENENENIIINAVKNKKEKTYKNSYWVYLKRVLTAYRDLINDESEMQKQEEFFPNVDIKKSLEKSVRQFWGTKAGWKNKKGKRSKDINMRLTLLNNIDKNKVWKKREEKKPEDKFQVDWP